MIVGLTPAAQRHLAEIKRYIGERNPADALGVIRAIQQAASDLETFPNRWREG